MPNIPLHIQARMRKSISIDGMVGDSTDVTVDAQREVVHGQPGPDYRVPVGRNRGNLIFRRWQDGRLDVESAASEVISILAKVRAYGPITDFEKILLTVAFPGIFSFSDRNIAAKMLTAQGTITVAEMQEIAMVVASRLAEEENYNGGSGGGTVPGRRVTVG